MLCDSPRNSNAQSESRPKEVQRDHKAAFASRMQARHGSIPGHAAPAQPRHKAQGTREGLARSPARPAARPGWTAAARLWPAGLQRGRGRAAAVTRHAPRCSGSHAVAPARLRIPRLAAWYRDAAPCQGGPPPTAASQQPGEGRPGTKSPRGPQPAQSGPPVCLPLLCGPPPPRPHPPAASSSEGMTLYE